MNLAYKHLDAKLRIAVFTIPQWCGVFFGVFVALAWGAWLHPLSGLLNTVTAMYLGGIPVLLAWLAAENEVDIFMYGRCIVRWRRGGDRYLPGPGRERSGYIVTAPTVLERDRVDVRVAAPELSALWD